MISVFKGLNELLPQVVLSHTNASYLRQLGQGFGQQVLNPKLLSHIS